MSDDLTTRIDRLLKEVPPGDNLYRYTMREFLVDARAALAARDKEIARLQSLICGVNLIADEAPELNMSNYNEDDVSALNDAMINVWQTTADEASQVAMPVLAEKEPGDG